MGSRDPILSGAPGSLLRLMLSPVLLAPSVAATATAACPLPASPGCWLSSAPGTEQRVAQAGGVRLCCLSEAASAPRTALLAAHCRPPAAATRCTLPSACCTLLRRALLPAAWHTLHFARHTLHITQHTLHIAHCILHTAHCALHTAHHTLLTVHCMLCHSSLPPALCALPTAAPAHDIPSRGAPRAHLPTAVPA